MTRPRPVRRAPLLALALLVLGGCSVRSEHEFSTRTRPEEAHDVAAITEAARAFSAAYERGDAAAMAALYTPDATIFPSGADAIAGREAIRRYWTLPPGSRVTLHRSTPTAIEVEGDAAYDHGVYEIAGERGGEAWGPTRGKYVIVWKRQPSGTWRMHLDIWNSGPGPR